MSYYVVCLCLPFIKGNWAARTLAAMGLFLILISGCHSGIPSPTSLRITWLDIGRQLCVLIETKEGQKVLINPYSRSPSNHIERTVQPFLIENRIRELDAIVVTTREPHVTDELKSKTILHLEDEISVGPLRLKLLRGAPSFAKEESVLIEYKEKKVVLSHLLSIETQYQLMKEGKVDLIQSRFSPKMVWNEKFLDKCEPSIVIETGLNNERQPSTPPWKNATVIVPQEKGWWVWSD